MDKTKNSIKLSSFTRYCLANPEMRFWQALRNWAGVNFILTAKSLDFDSGEFKDIKDTFYD